METASPDTAWTGQGLLLHGAAASQPLRNSRTGKSGSRSYRSDRDSLVHAARRTDPRRDATGITRACIEFAASLLNWATPRPQIRAAPAGRCPVGTRRHPDRRDPPCVSRGSQSGPRFAGNPRRRDTETLGEISHRMVAQPACMSSTVTSAYLQELKAVIGEHHNAADTLASALLGGHANSTMARECGIQIHETYFVVAAAIQPRPDNGRKRPMGRTATCLYTHSAGHGRSCSPAARRRCGCWYLAKAAPC